MGIDLAFSKSVIIWVRISGSVEWIKRVWHLNCIEPMRRREISRFICCMSHSLLGLSSKVDRGTDSNVFDREIGVENVEPTRCVKLFECNWSCKVFGSLWKWILEWRRVGLSNWRYKLVHTLENCSAMTVVWASLVLNAEGP